VNRYFDLPETQDQAEEWERRKSAYLAAGLCRACAVTASYGHQLGWHRVQYPPCDVCAPLVAAFPQETGDPAWRKWPRGRTSVPAVRSGAGSGVHTCEDAPTGSRNDLRQSA
jgi:hypothetical protein